MSRASVAAAILAGVLLAACGVSYWLKEIERAEGIQVGAQQAQGASEAELDRLGAALCNGYADRYATLAQQVLALRADDAMGRPVSAQIALAQDKANQARGRMDGMCSLVGIRPVPRPVVARPADAGVQTNDGGGG
jgi:hypothetical protein